MRCWPRWKNAARSGMSSLSAVEPRDWAPRLKRLRAVIEPFLWKRTTLPKAPPVVLQNLFTAAFVICGRAMSAWCVSRCESVSGCCRMRLMWFIIWISYCLPTALVSGRFTMRGCVFMTCWPVSSYPVELAVCRVLRPVANCRHCGTTGCEAACCTETVSSMTRDWR